jgi:hypothetical protein
MRVVLVVCAMALAGCVTCRDPVCRGQFTGLPFECKNSDDQYRSAGEACACEVPPVSGNRVPGEVSCH